MLASPLYSGDPPAPPDFTAIQQHSQIVYKVVNLASGKSVEKPVSELHCPPLRSQLRRVRDERGVVSLKLWEPAAKAAPFFKEAESSLAAGHLEQAADAHAQGLALSPEFGPGWVYAGDVQFARKDYAGALGFYRKALALDPSLAQAHHFAADSLFKLDRLSEAEDEYVQALVYEPSYEEVLRSLEEIVGPKAGFTVHRPVIPTPVGAVGQNVDGKVEIGVADPEWLQYLSCKAVWRYEDAYRKAKLAAAPKRYSRSLTIEGTTYTWSVAEEAECLRSYVAGNLSATAVRLKEQGAGSGRSAEVSREKVLADSPELVRTLVQVEDADLLDGFILFTLFGQRCPSMLALFSDAERSQLERFIRKFVIVHGEAASSPLQRPPQASPPAVSSGEPQPPSINPPFSGYERTVTLAPDLSGTARVVNVLNMETLVGAAEKGQTAAEIAAMREKWTTLFKNSEKALPRWRASIEKGLPQGVKLVGAWQKTESLKSTTTFAFTFDHVAKLAQIDLRSPGSKASAKDRPFAELTFTVQGDALLITSQPAEPPRGKNVMEVMAYRLETPLEVLEANTTRREGNTLIWEFDPYEIQTTGRVPAEIKARLKTTR